MGKPNEEVKKYLHQKKALSLCDDWFKARPSMYPPTNLFYDMVESEKGIVIHHDHNIIISMKREDAEKHKAGGAKCKTIMFKFFPMGKRQAAAAERMIDNFLRGGTFLTRSVWWWPIL
jgi:hypothetical protein